MCLYLQLFNYIVRSLFSGVSEGQGEAWCVMYGSLRTGVHRYEKIVQEVGRMSAPASLYKALIIYQTLLFSASTI